MGRIAAHLSLPPPRPALSPSPPRNFSPAADQHQQPGRVRVQPVPRQIPLRRERDRLRRRTAAASARRGGGGGDAGAPRPLAASSEPTAATKDVAGGRRPTARGGGGALADGLHDAGAAEAPVVEPDPPAAALRPRAHCPRSHQPHHAAPRLVLGGHHFSQPPVPDQLLTVVAALAAASRQSQPLRRSVAAAPADSAAASGSWPARWTPSCAGSPAASRPAALTKFSLNRAAWAALLRWPGAPGRSRHFSEFT
jgi:hypothetical protein